MRHTLARAIPLFASVGAAALLLGMGPAPPRGESMVPAQPAGKAGGNKDPLPPPAVARLPMSNSLRGYLMVPDRQASKSRANKHPQPPPAVPRLPTSKSLRRYICLAFAPDGKTLASGGDSLTLWAVRGGEVMHTRFENFYINSVAFA